MTIVSCTICDAEFNCPPSRIAQGKGKFCSRKCQSAYPRERRAFAQAKHRCNPDSDDWRFTTYREKGIQVKFESFRQFIDELGPCPEGLTLERIDNMGHYEPGNVRWDTRKAQSRNREYVHKIEYGGAVKTIQDWAEITGLKPKTIWARLQTLGWDVERSLETPSRQAAELSPLSRLLAAGFSSTPHQGQPCQE
jgi:hypothetical protein